MTVERQNELRMMVQNGLMICEMAGYSKLRVADFVIDMMYKSPHVKKLTPEEETFVRQMADNVNGVTNVNTQPVNDPISDIKSNVNANVGSGVGVSQMDTQTNGTANVNEAPVEQNIGSQFVENAKPMPKKPRGSFSFTKSFEFDKETGDFKFALPKEEELVEIANCIGQNPERVIKAAVGSGVKQVANMAQKSLENKLCVFGDDPKGRALNGHMSDMIGCLFNIFK